MCHYFTRLESWLCSCFGLGEDETISKNKETINNPAIAAPINISNPQWFWAFLQHARCHPALMFLSAVLAAFSRGKAPTCPKLIAEETAEALGISPETAKRELFNALASDYFGAFACSWASTFCAVSNERFARASQLAGSTKGCGSPALRVASSLARSRMPPPG
jgi:hypothetical protein